MAPESTSPGRPALTIALFVIAVFGFALAGVATVALIQSRKQLNRLQENQFGPDRWRIETPPAVQNGNAEVQRLQIENNALRNALTQMQSQFRNFEVSRPATRSYVNSSRSSSS